MNDHIDEAGSDQLAIFQAAVLGALHRGGDSVELRSELAAAAPDDALAAWVETWEPELVSLSSLLVETWSVIDASS